MLRSSLVRLAAKASDPKLGSVRCVFKTRHQGVIEAEGKVGQSLMQAGKDAGVDIEAACDGACACCTCHCFVDERYIDKLPPRSEDEEDMLDMAIDLRDNSRLACQISLTNELDGIVVEMPEEVSSQLL
eukprot:TRINITY_DN57984_c0_g1_i1.p2 TRINITY_DN57984_c0_g1~~TRINITY_DN57984_c0_g1_i1.p2  ORF type:complete len:129 (+),score=54.49 TRINITY_DN57984_c0_g1_i1:126-512(+)